jgi:hypothetical protein
MDVHSAIEFWNKRDNLLILIQFLWRLDIKKNNDSWLNDDLARITLLGIKRDETPTSTIIEYLTSSY